MIKNGMFFLKIDNVTLYYCITIVHIESCLCHLRFGHLNVVSLNKMGSENMVKCFSYINYSNQICECCILGKQHKNSFLEKNFVRDTKSLRFMRIYVYNFH